MQRKMIKINIKKNLNPKMNSTLNCDIQSPYIVIETKITH